MTHPSPTTVILADDHGIVRRGLRALLKADGRITIVGEARNGREAVELAGTLRPDVIVMDIAMPVLSGLEATRMILAANPAAKVIILSAHNDDEYIERASSTGAAGFIGKQMAGGSLASGILEVAGGGTCYKPSPAKLP